MLIMVSCFYVLFKTLHLVTPFRNREWKYTFAKMTEVCMYTVVVGFGDAENRTIFACYLKNYSSFDDL